MNNESKCACTYLCCPRHGNCRACQDYHHRSGGATACGR